jgi:hypothetical protein
VVRGQVLAYLLDVKTSTQLSGGKQGFQLAFVFAENPYFSDRLLTKTYLMDPEDEDECLERAAGCQINWKEGMNVTVKLVQKKQKKKGKTRTARPAAPSPPPHAAPIPPPRRRAAAPPRRLSLWWRRGVAGQGRRADRLILPVLRPARAAGGRDGRGGHGAAAGSSAHISPTSPQ